MQTTLAYAFHEIYLILFLLKEAKSSHTRYIAIPSCISIFGNLFMFKFHPHAVNVPAHCLSLVHSFCTHLEGSKTQLNSCSINTKRITQPYTLFSVFFILSSSNVFAGHQRPSCPHYTLYIKTHLHSL